MDANFSLLNGLKSKMKWHEARQGVLAQNIANAETPQYIGYDLKAFNADTLKSSTSMSALTTHHAHMQSGATSGTAFETQRAAGFEVTPEGNGVVLEDQMSKIAANQLQYRTATTIYTKSLGLLRLAIGSR